MKIGDLSSVRDYGIATLDRAGDAEPITLKIRAVGSEVERLRAHPCWHVEPPVQFRRDKDNKIVRDKNNEPVKVKNEDDPAYRAQVSEINALWGVAYVYLGLVPKSENGDVAFDTDPAGLEQNPLDFFRDIQREMIDVGLSQGAVSSLFRQIHALSVPTAKEVEEAEQSFQDAGR